MGETRLVLVWVVARELDVATLGIDAVQTRSAYLCTRLGLVVVRELDFANLGTCMQLSCVPSSSCTNSSFA